MEQQPSPDDLTDSELLQAALLVFAARAQRPYPALARRAREMANRTTTEAHG